MRLRRFQLSLYTPGRRTVYLTLPPAPIGKCEPAADAPWGWALLQCPQQTVVVRHTPLPDQRRIDMPIHQKTTVGTPAGPITFGEFEANRAPLDQGGRRSG